jgi:hypothetical protein
MAKQMKAIRPDRESLPERDLNSLLPTVGNPTHSSISWTPRVGMVFFPDRGLCTQSGDWVQCLLEKDIKITSHLPARGACESAAS